MQTRRSIIVCSCLNKANRIPANEDWTGTADEAVADHIEELAAAILMHAHTDRSEYALMLTRIPKCVLAHKLWAE